jgi:hypothetical protein
VRPAGGYPPPDVFQKLIAAMQMAEAAQYTARLKSPDAA